MTTPTAKNRKHIASVRDGSHSNPSPGVSGPSDQAGSLQRGIGARLRGMGLGVQTEPLREMRLQVGFDLHVIYFTLRMPVAGGVSLRLPVMATFAPRIYSPTTGAQHLSVPHGQR